MVSFQKTPKPRNYLSRREQRRLLLLVLALGLVVFLIMEADDLAEKLCGSENSPPGASGSTQVTEIDNRLEPPSQKDEIPGTFTSPAPVKDDAPEDTTGRYFPGVKPVYLKEVRDNTTFRKQEHQAWFNLLDILNKTDEATLERESTGRVTYAQLFQQSSAYRGELVTVRGKIRRAHRLPCARNALGLQRYHRVWLWPDDNPSSPMVVYCLHLPDGFPMGMEIEEEAKISGFFFKCWVYGAKDGLRTAPSLLAKTVRWHRRPPVEERSLNPVAILGVIAVAAVVSLLVAVYVYVQTRRGQPAEPDTPPNLDVLRDVDAAFDTGQPPESVDNREQEE